MSKKKRRSGHYCKICHEYRSNESFSGKGHANHICKRCSKKSPADQAADMTLNRLNNLPFRKLRQAEKSWLENRLQDQREEVKTAAQEIYKQLYPHSERNNRKKQLHINKLSFRIHAKAFDERRHVQNANCLLEADKMSNNIVQTEFSSGGSPARRQEKFIVNIDMAKFLKWIVHSLEISEWEQDYCQNNEVLIFQRMIKFIVTNQTTLKNALKVTKKKFRMKHQKLSYGMSRLITRMAQYRRQVELMFICQIRQKSFIGVFRNILLWHILKRMKGEKTWSCKRVLMTYHGDEPGGLACQKSYLCVLNKES